MWTPGIQIPKTRLEQPHSTLYQIIGKNEIEKETFVSGKKFPLKWNKNLNVVLSLLDEIGNGNEDTQLFFRK